MEHQADRAGRDCAAARRRVVGARGGTIRDPFGWFVQTAIEADDVPVEDVSGRRYGDIGYLMLDVADGDQGGALLRGLFDWQLEPATDRARSTSRRSPRPRASTAGPGTRRSACTSASTTSKRPRRASAISAARCCRSPTTTPAATPSASTTRDCASTSSGPSPATEDPRGGRSGARRCGAGVRRGGGEPARRARRGD